MSRTSSSARAESIDSADFANDDDDIFQGWVSVCKDSKVLRRDKKRFLMLKGTLLSQYRRPSSREKWTENIFGASIGPGPRPCELVVTLPHRTVSIMPKNDVDYQRWMFALTRAASKRYVIGTGHYGEVLIGWDKETNEEVAIKTIGGGGDAYGIELYENADEEVGIMKSLQHKRLVRTYEVLRDPLCHRLYVVMEFVRGGELFARVDNESGNLITERDAVRVVKDILSGVRYLHDPVRNIVHRDIKLENILCVDRDISRPVRVKLADFGLSRRLTKEQPTCDEYVGTPQYLAPEIVRREPYGKPVDMWAIGVATYIMLSQLVPFEGKEEEYKDNILSQEIDFPDEVFSQISADTKNFVKGLMDKNPDSRMNIAQAADHRWLGGKYLWKETDGDNNVSAEGA